MEGEKALFYEEKLNRIAAYSPYIHCIGLGLLLIIGYLKPKHYTDISEGVALLFFFITFIINRIYIHTGKQVENYKTFSEEEGKKRKLEYRMKFFAPIWFWTACILVVSK